MSEVKREEAAATPPPQPPAADEGAARDDTAPAAAEAAPEPAVEEGAPEAEEVPAGEPEAAQPEREAELEAEVAALRDQLLRALAEAENIRKRAEREREDAAKYGVAGFTRDLLSPVDNLRRALEAVPPDAADDDEPLKNLLAGVELTERELLRALEKHGVRKVEPLDVPFDHNLHQAMFEVPNTGKPAGTVVELLQPGYVLHQRLLRPALVGVAKADKGDTSHQPVDTVA
jgi:molecular chaperone GrpE